MDLRSHLPLVLAALPIALGAALWSVGDDVALPPAALGLLLGATVLASFVALAGAALARERYRPVLRWAGILGLFGVGAFAALLFHRASGDVPVVRRTTAPSGPAGRIRIVTLNVEHDYPAFRDLEDRLRVLLAALRALDPTVVILQEAWRIAGHGSLADRLGEGLGLDVAYASANGSRRLIGFEEGSAVLSRLPILAARRLVLEPWVPIWERRVALLATLDLGGDERLEVVGTHLAAGRPAVADEQAERLADLLPDAPFLVLAGDLNRDQHSDAVLSLLRRGLAGVLAQGVDHVLVRAPRGWRIETASATLGPEDLARLLGAEAGGIPSGGLSDHPALLVDLVRDGR